MFLPQKTIFEEGAAKDIAKEALLFGTQGLVVYGKSLEKNGHKEEILNKFPAAARVATFCRARSEPTLLEISQVITSAKKVDAQWIVGVGGGSVLDVAKAAAGLYNASQNPDFYQQGGKLDERGIPFIAVPTTAGSGSEATINSVIINPDTKEKLSIRDKSFLAKVVILDAQLLKGIPISVMSYAAMDAFVQAYESFISKNSTWFSQEFALKAIKLINDNIVHTYESYAEEYFAALLLGSYFSGIGFSISRLGVIHGIAHPLGVLYNLPHGLICAACLVPSIKLHKEIIPEKYDTLSSALGQDLLSRAESLIATLKINSPFKGRELIEKEKIINSALKSGSTAADPKQITRSDLEFILDQIF